MKIDEKNIKTLPVSFYTRKDVVQISQELLGKYFYSHINGEWTGGIIVETEAYHGANDKACHAYPNKRTKRTETLYQEGGIAYVYLCYGIHSMLNIVTNEKEVADAILIRAIEPTTGIEIIKRRRKMTTVKPQLTAGPGCLTKALAITCEHDRFSLAGSTFYLTDHCLESQTSSIEYKSQQIIASPRVGIDYAEEHALLPWRFRIKNNRWTSKAK